MNYPVWYIPEVGGGLLFALLALGAGFRKNVLLSATLLAPLGLIMVFIRDAVRTG